MNESYEQFLEKKSQLGGMYGFKPIWIPDFLFDFQKHLVDWNLRKGKSSTFADCGLGKGQPYGSKILTPKGWINIENLRVGDEVFSGEGKIQKTIGVYPKQEINTYRFYYSDGASCVFDEDHLHICRTNNDRQRGKKWRVLSTKELLQIPLKYGNDNKSRNFDIPIVSPVQFPKKDLKISPYVIGALLGDGSFLGNINFSTSDKEVLFKMKNELPDGISLEHKSRYDYKIMTGPSGNRHHIFRQEIIELGLHKKLSYQKHIPEKYLLSSIEDRIELLRGLMDTDGYISECGTCQFYTTSEALKNNVKFLIQSLGGIPTESTKLPTFNYLGEKKSGRLCHVLTFSLKTFNPFYLKRKADKWISNPRDNGRWIDQIEFEKVQKTICIAVDSSDKSYVTENCIITHNTPMQLVFAQNIVEKTNGNVLIATPLAVSEQTIREGIKFGIEVNRSKDGKIKKGITVTNYERLHYFNPDDFDGFVGDESSCIKNFEGERQKQVRQFSLKIPYRLLCTATAAPNDFIELGTTAETLGELGRMDMLSRFFVNDENSNHPIWWGARWRFKKHAEIAFWKWICSWARACRKPSDLGFSDSNFILPELIVNETIVKNDKPLIINGQTSLFAIEAKQLKEQRAERRLTIDKRCNTVLEKVMQHDTSVIWCHLNDEADLLEKIIPGSKQVSGSDSDDEKEETFKLFTSGELKRLITKPKIGCFGLNWQHCNHMTFFPSHSYEQYYQGVRRCWRFGQTKPVTVDVVTSDGERGVFKNLKRKSEAADKMFEQLVMYMNDALKIDNRTNFHNELKLPVWL